MSQPGVMGPLQEIMSNPQVGLQKHMDNQAVMKTFMTIQKKMKALAAAPPPPPPVEGEAEELSEGDMIASAVAVLLKRGRAALMRRDVEKARGALRAGLQIKLGSNLDQTTHLDLKQLQTVHLELKQLAQDIKIASDQQA